MVCTVEVNKNEPGPRQLANGSCYYIPVTFFLYCSRAELMIAANTTTWWLCCGHGFMRRPARSYSWLDDHSLDHALSFCRRSFTAVRSGAYNCTESSVRPLTALVLIATASNLPSTPSSRHSTRPSHVASRSTCLSSRRHDLLSHFKHTDKLKPIKGLPESHLGPHVYCQVQPIQPTSVIFWIFAGMLLVHPIRGGHHAPP